MGGKRSGGLRVDRGGECVGQFADLTEEVVEDARAGVERRVHAHGLRHTHAAELAREGVAVNVIRDALGHTSLAVTDRYLRDVAPQHVIDTMRARTWAA